MQSFIERERIRLETRIKNKEQRKSDKEQRYRAWLEKPTRPLPSYERLAKYRRLLGYAALVSMFGCTIEVMFFYDTCWIGGDYGYPIIFLGLGWIFGGLAAMFDYGIYKRWEGKKPHFIKWKGP